MGQRAAGATLPRFLSIYMTTKPLAFPSLSSLSPQKMAPSAPTSSSSMNTRATMTKPFPTRPRRRRLKSTTRIRRLNNKKHNPPPPPQTTSPKISKIPEVSEVDSPSSSSSSSEVITTDEPFPPPPPPPSCCSTPKGHKFRIPEITTCPPAPKKKPVSLFSNNCSRRRSPISFFAPPDLELFFFLALPDNISI